MIRAAVAGAKSRGDQTFSADALDLYLSELEALSVQEPNQLDQIALERTKGDFSVALEKFKTASGERLEMFRSVVTTGQAAIQSSLLINGGAAVALLAFIGHSVTSPTSRHLVS